MNATKKHLERSRKKLIPVYVVLPPRTMLLDVAGPLEVLRVANLVQNVVRFCAIYIGPDHSVTTSVGISLAAVQPLPRHLPSGSMLVLAGNADKTMNGPDDALASVSDQRQEAAIVRWLKKTVRAELTLVCICSGSLLAARAGLLDGCACTTHHACCAELAQIAPKARVLENRLYVQDKMRFTSAGVTAGIDLMLYLLRQYAGDAAAVAVARHLVVYLRRNGSDPQFSPWLEARNHIHQAVHRVQDAIASNPANSWTLQELAKIAAASSRHLSRVFARHAGMTIVEYRNRLRLELAREFLSNTHLDMEAIAERTGFCSSRQLRRAWRRMYSSSPKEVRTVSGMTAVSNPIRAN